MAFELREQPRRAGLGHVMARERRSRSSTHEVAPSLASVSSSLNFCAHASAGRQTSWSTATIIAVIATAAATMARTSPWSIATLMYEPIPGSRKSWSPSVKASVTVRKNQPPAIDIIEFHTRPIIDDGTSRVRKRFHQPKR